MLKVFGLSILALAMKIPSTWAVKSESIVICAETGTVYYEANADAPTPPASLTKMMTLYLTFKALREGRLKPHQHLSISRHASQQAPSKLGLKPGHTITVKQAILALITKSANDAAVVLAEALGRGSETAFANTMTQQARKLGMTKTIFKNASGLPNKHQVSTARDMATLSRALYKHFPEYFKLFKEQKFTYKGQVHINHNHLLGKVKGVDGIKTGFTNASGFNLAASMVRENHRLIAVVLGGETIKARDKKMEALLENTYRRLKGKTSPQPRLRYASMSDLIHTLGPSEAHADPLLEKKENVQKAAYLSSSGKVVTLKDDYDSLEDLLNVINRKPPPQKAKTKKVNSSRKKKRRG